MIRTAMCFLALLFVISCAVYLPAWVERYRSNVIAMRIAK